MARSRRYMPDMPGEPAPLFRRCFMNEVSMLFARPRNRAVPAAAAAVSVLWALAVWLVGGGAFPVTFPVTFNLEYSPLTVLAFMAEAFIPLQALLLAADLYTEARKYGLARFASAAGVGAGVAYWSKFLAVLAYCAASFAALFVVSSACAALHPLRRAAAAMAPLAAAAAADAPQAPALAGLVVAYAVTSAPMFVAASMAALAANLSKSSFAAVASGLAAYVSLKVAGSFSGAVANASFTSYMQWHVLWAGKMPPTPRIASIALLFGATGAACLSGGYLAFTAGAAAAPARRRKGGGDAP